MDQLSAGGAMRNGARVRRWRMRDLARSQHAGQSPVTDRYQTPEWLERSFVLPLTHPEASDVPSQSVPHHDDDVPRTSESRVIDQHPLAAPATPAGSPEPVQPGVFVRPPSEAIDFATAVRRADLCRRSGRLAWATAGMAGIALIAHLLFAATVVLGATIAFTLVSLVALAMRVRLSRAPIPRVQP